MAMYQRKIEQLGEICINIKYPQSVKNRKIKHQEINTFVPGDEGLNSTRLSDDTRIIKIIKAYLIDGLSYRNIEKMFFDVDSPARGGGFIAMGILH
jgi:hypothetical protein